MSLLLSTTGNAIPPYFSTQRDYWNAPDFCYQITADDDDDEDSKPLREKNSRKNGKCAVHVPHRDKPPQVVARRNARERRRVQAVNGAFVRLRKAVPFQNARGKRVSKVKTLQNAIEYIQNLQELLKMDSTYQTSNIISNCYYDCPQNDFLDCMDQDEGYQEECY